MDYRALSELVARLDATTYACLLVTARDLETGGSGDGSKGDRVWKARLEELVRSSLRDRPLDWQVAYSNVFEMVSRSEGSLEAALVLASKLGLLNEVAILIEAGVNPGASDNAAIIIAAEEDQADVVSLLLGNPGVDPTVNDNKPYRIANRDGHFEIARILLDDRRVRSLVA